MLEAVFRNFIKQERQRLIRYARSFLRETAELDAEDLVHDVLIKLLERPGGSESMVDMTGYVYRSIRNRVIDSVRTRKPTVSLDAESDAGPNLLERLEDPGLDALAMLQAMESEQELFDALQTLSKVEREVLIAHEFEGVPFKELSAAMHIPQNTLLSHKARALKKLQDHFLNLE